MSNKHEFKTIVVPYDGSDQAKHAFSMACDLIGDDPDAKLMLLHVVLQAWSAQWTMPKATPSMEYRGACSIMKRTKTWYMPPSIA